MWSPELAEGLFYVADPAYLCRFLRVSPANAGRIERRGGAQRTKSGETIECPVRKRQGKGVHKIVRTAFDKSTLSRENDFIFAPCIYPRHSMNSPQPIAATAALLSKQSYTFNLTSLMKDDEVDLDDEHGLWKENTPEEKFKGDLVIASTIVIQEIEDLLLRKSKDGKEFTPDELVGMYLQLRAMRKQIQNALLPAKTDQNPQNEMPLNSETI